MGDIKVFDIVYEVIKEATSQFYPIWGIDEERLHVLQQYCDVIDILRSESGAEGYTVDIDDINMTINIGIVGYDFSINNNFKMFNELMDRTVKFSVSKDKEFEDMIIVCFTFPSVWSKV